MGSNTIAITDQTFENEVLKSKVPVLLDFWAEWCAPCRALGPTLEEVAAQFKGQLKVAKINIDENPEVPTQFGIRSIPTMILFKDGQQVDQAQGNIGKSALVTFVQKSMA